MHLGFEHKKRVERSGAQRGLCKGTVRSRRWRWSQQDYYDTVLFEQTVQFSIFLFVAAALNIFDKYWWGAVTDNIDFSVQKNPIKPLNQNVTCVATVYQRERPVIEVSVIIKTSKAKLIYTAVWWLVSSYRKIHNFHRQRNFSLQFDAFSTKIGVIIAHEVNLKK